jgi:hypothetical protein
VLVCLSAGVGGDTKLHHPGDLPEFLPRNDPEAAKQEKTGPSGVDVISGELTLAFGAVRVRLGRDAEDAVHFLQLLLAGGVADTVGLLLALVWTAGFLPTFLEPNSVTVLLAKPAPRWCLLAGKYLGVLTFVAFQAAVFVGGTWLALGLRTGVWGPYAGGSFVPVYLLCVPVLLIHFAIFYGFSTLLAVLTRSAVGSVLGSIIFWFLCWGMNYARHAAVALPDFRSMPASFRTTVEAGYWVLPKPADLGILLYNGLQAGNSFAQALAFQTVQSQGAFYPELSLLTSLLFTAVILLIAGREFSQSDY